MEKIYLLLRLIGYETIVLSITSTRFHFCTKSIGLKKNIERIDSFSMTSNFKNNKEEEEMFVFFYC
jgi:hypothetical protein